MATLVVIYSHLPWIDPLGVEAVLVQNVVHSCIDAERIQNTARPDRLILVFRMPRLTKLFVVVVAEVAISAIPQFGAYDEATAMLAGQMPVSGRSKSLQCGVGGLDVARGSGRKVVGLVRHA